MSLLRRACSCCRPLTQLHSASAGSSASFSTSQTSLQGPSAPLYPRPQETTFGPKGGPRPPKGPPRFGKSKPGGFQKGGPGSSRSGGVGNGGPPPRNRNFDGPSQRSQPGNDGGFGLSGSRSTNTNRTPAARFEQSSRPPRSTWGSERSGSGFDTGSQRESVGGERRNFGRDGGYNAQREGSYGENTSRSRDLTGLEGRFGFGATTTTGGRYDGGRPRRFDSGSRDVRSDPPSSATASGSTETNAADDALPGDDEAPYASSSSRGRSASSRGGPSGRATDVEKTSRSYREAEGGEFVISRGKDKGGQNQSRDKGRAKNREAMNLERIRSEREKNRKTKEVGVKIEKKVFVPSSVSVGRLADIFGVKIFDLQRTMQRLGSSEDHTRSNYLLTSEEACNIALEYGLDPTVDDERTFDIFPELEVEGVVQPLRPPVVTIMGHVDHGKTTLLDSLRHSSVATGEAGGITQHIGAFSVPLSSLLPSASIDSETPGTITFLDTPGHAAFTAMRARGASVTDMIVLVVAADDGVMPQTREVIELWKADQDKVGLVVAINKCDKAGIDFDKIKSALGAEGILLEEDGGDIPSVRVSGLKGLGLDKLVETLSTLAEIRELRARKEGKAEGYVLESRVDRGQGNVATILITKGTLSAGDCIVAGTTWARVRQMQDSAGRSVRSAPPGTPVSIMGWREIPHAGDQLLEATTEDEAKKAITNRLREIENKKLLADVESINLKRLAERKKVEKEEEELNRLKEEGKTDAEIQTYKREIERGMNNGEGFENLNGKKSLRLVIKGDVSGSVEAVVGSLESIGNKEAGVKIIHVGVGEVGESDVHMAEAAGASIIAFSVPTSRSTQNLARSLNVPLHSDSVIYRLIETVRSEVIKLLPAIYESRVTGEATCQAIFEIKMKGKEVIRIAGCKVGNGIIEMKEGVGIRVLRGEDRKQVYEGTIETLKHLKKDVTEVRKGTECGISFHGFTDIKEGDEIIAFTKFEVPRHL